MSDEELDDRLVGWKHRISKLEKKFEALDLHVDEMIKMSMDKEKEIAELKEHSEGVLNSAIEGDRRIKEVLRELKEIIIDLTWNLNFDNSYNMGEIRERLAKLDGKTEKKDTALDLDLQGYRKASGGEKPPENMISRVEIDDPDATVLITPSKIIIEKPREPEPKMTDDEIMLFNEEIMAKVNKREVQPIEPKWELESDGTFNSAFPKEPREEDKIAGIEVKCPICLKPMKYYFKSGKELISEFVEELKDMKNELGTNYFDSYILKWEAKLK